MENEYISRLVHNEVYACISDMNEYLFGWDGSKYASYNEWDNMYKPHCPSCGERLDVNHDKSIICDYCNMLIDSDSVELMPVEIYEYWLVSPFLGELLREHGEPVLERYGSWVWGRTTSGQSITLDNVIHDISSKITEISDSK